MSQSRSSHHCAATSFANFGFKGTLAAGSIKDHGALPHHAKADPILNAAQAGFFANHYLGDADPRHPHASPLYGDLRGMPPALIQVGSDEILRDDAERMAQRLRDAGCRAELEVWPRMPHVWHFFARILPEGRQAVARVGEFVRATFAKA